MMAGSGQWGSLHLTGRKYDDGTQNEMKPTVNTLAPFTIVIYK
jgi:hypothetical protein